MQRHVWWFAKFLLTGGLIWFVLRKVDLGGLTRTLGGMSLEATLVVLVLTVASAAVSAWRWHRVLRRLGLAVPLPGLLGDTLVGTAYNLLLPTSVGGDVVRSVRLGRRIGDPELAWASVVFERVVGLFALAVVSAAGLAYTLSAKTRPILLLALGMALGLGAMLVLAPVPLGFLARVGGRFHRRSAEFFARLGQAFAGPLAQARARLETLGWSLLYQLVALSVLVAPALGWHEPRLLEAVYLGVPIALIGATAPVTLGGLGLRESLFVVVLEPFGISAERALGLSLVWLGSNLVVGGLGVLVIWWGRR
jgi:glycosyltransferase 2 family protein